MISTIAIVVLCLFNLLFVCMIVSLNNRLERANQTNAELHQTATDLAKKLNLGIKPPPKTLIDSFRTIKSKIQSTSSNSSSSSSSSSSSNYFSSGGYYSGISSDSGSSSSSCDSGGGSSGGCD